MISHIKIQPIKIGELQEKEANAISWYVPQLQRNADSAIAICSLINIVDLENSSFVSSFQVEIDNETLQSWGDDDSVIDNIVLAYSPLFQKI
mgnify:CR=1 FL=1|tara:strand:- start:10007 stop:10282 length:276 start_codon:yes stop_codon:yes gene_type:complete